MDNRNAQTKVPFYMTYPMQNLYLMEMEYEKDMERMKELYPQRVQQLMPYVEDFCDGLEYEGSRIYDENPDMWMMREACEKLFEQIPAERKNSGSDIRCSAFSLNPPDGWELPSEREKISEDMSPVQMTEEERELVGLLFADEIYRRRCRHRRCRRWW